MPIQIKIPIEIPFGISMFALIFAESITINWMMYRTCYTTLGFNETDCALLGSGDTSNSTAELEQKVQPYVTIITMAKSLTQVVAAIVCFFLGPWSDKYGRKPILLLTFAAHGLSYATMAVISAIPSLSPWYVFLTTIPTSVTGGFIAQVTVVLCYISDITTTSSRGIRMAIFETASTGGVLVGTILSSFALNSYGYTIMYVITTSCYVLCGVLILLFVPESVKDILTNAKFQSFFELSFLRKSLTTTFKVRRGYARAILLISLSVLLTYAFAFTEYSFTFLYLRKTLNWSLQQFTIYNGGQTITGIVGSLLLVYILHTLLKVKESVMVLLGLLSAMSSALIIALATNNGYIYVGGAIKFLSGTVSPMARSLISKVALEDAGAVFGFLAVCETLTMLIGRFAYTYIYNGMIAAALYFFTAGVDLVAIILNLMLLFMEKHKGPVSNYNIMENEIG